MAPSAGTGYARVTSVGAPLSYEAALSCAMRMWFPNGSRRPTSMPYGCSTGSWVNSTQAVEADIEADVRDTAPGRAQEEHRALDAPPLQIAMRRFAERRPERPDEMRLGHFGNPRQPWDAERLRKSTVHGIPGPEQPPITRLY